MVKRESEERQSPETRWDFLYYATGDTGGVAAGAAIWPLIDPTNEQADVRALSTVQVDPSSVVVGAQITVIWQGKPVFVRRRTPEDIEEAHAVH